MWVSLSSSSYEPTSRLREYGVGEVHVLYPIFKIVQDIF